jgi:glycosyltransferase involved in cell wall biosynthesis
MVKYLSEKHKVLYLANVSPSEQEGARLMTEAGIVHELVPTRDHWKNRLVYLTGAACNLFRRNPFNVQKEYHAGLSRLVTKCAATGRYDCIVCDFVQSGLNVLEARRFAPIVLFTHNVEADLLFRRAKRARNPLLRWYLRLEARKLRRFEAQLGNLSASVIAVSKADQEKFERQYGWKHVHCIGTSVDTVYFQPMPIQPVAGRVVFVGRLNWWPNVQGVEHFVRHSWPLVLKARPDAQFYIVGADAVDKVRQLESAPGVRVFSSVPDTRPYFAEAEVVIVPLLDGSGTRLKIAEALAMARPVVTTSIGMEGLELEPEKHVLLADEPVRFAEQVLRLLGNHQLQAKLGQQARQWIEEHATPERVGERFEEACLAAASSRRSVKNVSPC